MSQNPLDYTLDELHHKHTRNNSSTKRSTDNRSRKRSRRQFNDYRNLHNNNYNSSATKRFKRNTHNSRPYRNDYRNNHQHHNYNANYYNNSRNTNRHRQNYNNFAPKQINYTHHRQQPPQYQSKPSAKLPSPPCSPYYIKPQTEEKKQADADAEEPKYGYVTLIMRGDSYIPGALILAHSLRLVHTKHSLIVMVTEDVTTKGRKALDLLYDHVITVPYIKRQCKPMKTEKQKEKYKEWASDSFTKWNILQLNSLLNVTFTKLLFLDSDKIVIKNIDSLFTDDIKCPAGTFSSPWTNKKSQRGGGLCDYYPSDIKHGDEVPAQCIYDALYKNGFVAVGTSMLFEPEMSKFDKFIKMLDCKAICNENMHNDIDKEKIRSRLVNKKFKIHSDEKSNAEKSDVVKSDQSEKSDVDKSDKFDFDESDVDKSDKSDVVKPDVVKFDQSEKSDVEKSDVEKPDVEKPDVDKSNAAKSDQSDKSNKPDAVKSDQSEKSVVDKSEKCDVDKLDVAKPDVVKSDERDIDKCGKSDNILIGFKDCYSMLDEQSIVFFYFYHKIAWNYIDTKYNFIPWHFKWLEDKNGSLGIPVVLHFFGMKPWNLSPLKWRDLQAWWGLVFNLVNYACDEQYKWNDEEKKLIESFFKLKFINELPLDLFIENKEGGEDGKDFDTETQLETKGRGFGDDRKARAEAKKKLKSKVTCFWCYELAKRKGLDPVELIKENKFDRIEWIFHCPIDPLSGTLCCPELLADSKIVS